MKELNIRDISRSVNTPAYVFSGEEFAERAAAVRDILGNKIGLCYSMKANPFLLEVLPESFCAVEVCSPGELEICIRRNILGERIIYSGLNKGAEDIARAVSYGAGIITAESRLHLDLINKVSAEAGVVSNVLVRISADSQFGIDRREAQELLKAHDDYPAIHFEGLHFFTGTQKRKPKEIIRELAFLGTYLEETRELSGLEFKKVEYGTGLPAYLFIDKEIKDRDGQVLRCILRALLLKSRRHEDQRWDGLCDHRRRISSDTLLRADAGYADPVHRPYTFR